jgi:hypothetical protein
MFDAQDLSMMHQKKHRLGGVTKLPSTPGTLPGRGREASLVAGRQPDRLTTSDLEQARKELMGAEFADTAADQPGIMAQELEAWPFSSGTKIENQLPRDDETTEGMVQEGVEDAERDERVAARKTRTKSEG